MPQALHCPVARFVIPFVCGVACGLAVSRTPLAVTLGVAALFLCLVPAVLVPKRRWNRSPRLALIVFSLMVAASGYLRVVLPAPQSSLPWPPGEATWQGVVTATAESPRSRRVTLHLLPDAVVQATLKKDSLSSALAPGDALRFRAQIVVPANIDSLSRFDYAAWLRRHGVVGTAFVWDRWQRLSPAVADSLAARLPWTARMQLAASRWRQALSRRYAVAVPSDRDRAVLSALTLGDRQRLTRDIRTTYSNAGVAHLLALSGLHLGIIVTFLLLLLRPLGRTRPGRVSAYLLSLTVIWLFAYVTGLTLPTLRAATMFSLFCLFLLQNRQGNALNSLFLSAFLILGISPSQLLEVGFQLSFLSVLAILLVLPLRRHYAGLCRPLVWLADLLLMSCAAQVATAPLVAHCFGTLPVYFLVSNVVAVPCAYMLLGGALVFFVLSPVPAVQGFCGDGLAFLSGALNGWLEWVSSWPFGVVNWQPGPVETAMCYGLAVVLWWHYRQPDWRKLALCIVLAGGWAVSGILSL